MAKTSPLHMVTDAFGWDAGGLLSRLLIVAHAAFLDAGFIMPRQVVRPATHQDTVALSFRYTAPQLLPKLTAWEAGVVLPMRAHGRHVLFYVGVRSIVFYGQPCPYWICVDALDTAPLLSGDLDETERSLLGADDSKPKAAALWRSISEGLCRRLHSDMCREHGVVPGQQPAFLSLPDDVMLAILSRLAYREEILSVRRTCTELRRLVANNGSKLRKPKEPSKESRRLIDEVTSWEERWEKDMGFFSLPVLQDAPTYTYRRMDELAQFVVVAHRCLMLLYFLIFFHFSFKPADAIAGGRTVQADDVWVNSDQVVLCEPKDAVSGGRAEDSWGKRAGGRKKIPMKHGYQKRCHGIGMIQSPSSS